MKQYDETKSRYNQVASTISAKEMQRVKLVYFTNELKGQHGLLHVFDCGLWTSLGDYVTVGRNKEITVTFRDGTEIQA